MKKFLLTCMILTGGFSMLHAQEVPADNDKKQKERLQALYVAYITKELNLTTEEAQKFWPEHTQFDNEIKAVKEDLPELDKEQKRLDIRKKYQERFIKIIGATRTDRFFIKDREFRRKLAERLRNRIKNRPPVRPNARRGV